MSRVRPTGVVDHSAATEKPATPAPPAQNKAAAPAPNQAFAPPQASVGDSQAGRALGGKSGFQTPSAPAKPARTGLWGALGKVEDGVKSVVHSLHNAFDIDANVDALKGGGDTYTVKLNAEAYVEAGAYGTTEIDVAMRDDGKYTVTSGGELGAGVWAEVGGKLGAKVDAQAFGTLGLGTKTEMTFDTAADAKRAAHLLAKDKELTVLGAAVPAAGPLVKTLLGPSKADRDFLQKHTSALLLYGDGVADINAVAGLKLKGPVQAGIFGDASVTAVGGVRVEVEGGKVKGLTLQHQLSGDVNAGAGINADGDENAGWTSGLVGGDANGQVTTELHYDVPKNLSLSDVMKSPLSALKSVVQTAGQSQRATVTVDLTGQSMVGGAGKGVQLETRFEGNPADLLQSGAIRSALHGKVQQAASQAGKAVKVDVTRTPFHQTGINVNPGVSLMGVGVEMIIQGGSQLYGDVEKKLSNHGDD